MPHTWCTVTTGSSFAGRFGLSAINWYFCDFRSRNKSDERANACDTLELSAHFPAAQRLKGYAQAGAYRNATLDTVAGAATVLRLPSLADCLNASCTYLVVVECIPAAEEPCEADEQGNVGQDNVGWRNVGRGNRGIANFGKYIFER